MYLFKKIDSIKIGLLTIFLILFSGLVTAENESQMITQISGEITIDADGKAKAVSLANVKDAKFEKYFIEKIKTWEFYPVILNGKSIEATAEFTFDLIATYRPDDTLKQFEFANILIKQSAIETEIKKNNVLKTGKVGLINYPLEAYHVGAEAKIVIVLDVTADGKVRKAEVFSIELINSSAGDVRVLAKAFSDNALKGVRKKEFSKDELAKLKCITGCISTFTVDFAMDGGSAWKTYRRLPIAPIPWVIASELKDMNASEKSQLVRLKEDPTGKPLEMGS